MKELTIQTVSKAGHPLPIPLEVILSPRFLLSPIFAYDEVILALISFYIDLFFRKNIPKRNCKLSYFADLAVPESLAASSALELFVVPASKRRQHMTI